MINLGLICRENCFQLTFNFDKKKLFLAHLANKQNEQVNNLKHIFKFAEQINVN